MRPFFTCNSTSQPLMSAGNGIGKILDAIQIFHAACLPRADSRTSRPECHHGQRLRSFGRRHAVPVCGQHQAAIRSIEAQIQKAGGEGARVAALPVTVASKEHGLIQTVIWRVETADGREKFVDYNPATQEARTYASFEDWKNNNQLPPGEMTYARNGHLTAGVDGKPQLETGNTPNTVDTAWEAWIKPALDRVALAGGIVLLGAAAVSTGGTAVMVGGALLSAYGAVTGGVELADRAAHGQTLSLDNAQARNAWLNVGASALSLGAMGASMRLANMSGRATGNAIDEAVQLTRMAQTARGLC